MSIDRRLFIGQGVTTLLALAPLPSALQGWSTEQLSARASRHLVLLFLRGGLDGLNAVVPHGDPGYHELRPTLGLQQVIDLDGFFGLHPSLAPLVPLWASGDLAIAHAVGLPNPSTSHVQAEHQLQTATAPLAPVALEQGPTRIVSSLTSAAGASYPPSALGARMSQVARLIKSGSAAAVLRVDAPGWDHHVLQGTARGPLAERLRDLAESLAAFARDLGPRLRQVTVATLTEFGRSAHENGTGGTDHGRATAMFVLGGGVHGGRVHGAWPGLALERLHDRGLAATTDVRDMLVELNAVATIPAASAAPSGSRFQSPDKP